MKQKQLSILAASLVAAFAANIASAGNIQSSSVAIARESITADAQAVNAPLITYSFQGDIDATAQAQTLQVQLVLTGGGTWKTATVGSIDLFGAADVFPAVAPAVLPGTGGATAPIIGTTTTAGDTLYITFTIPQGAGNRWKTPVLRFNATAPSILKNLFTTPVRVVAECDDKAYPLPVTVKHFTGVTAAGLANGTTNGTADEHVRNGQNSTGTLLTFPTNIALDVITSGKQVGFAGKAKIDPAGNNLFKFTAADAVTQSTTLVNLGHVSLRQQALGYDSGLQDVYAYTVATAGQASATKNGSVVATPADGFIEADELDVTVSSSQGFAIGSTVFLSLSPTCGAAIGGSSTVVTASTGNSLVTLLDVPGLTAMYGNVAFPSAAPYGAFTAQTVHVCYSVAGATSAIPPSSFAATALLHKAPGTLPSPEQNNSCKGNLFPLASGVKVDVRNYATSKTAGGWMSVIRLINPSETNTATVYGQLIHADGTYGGWGALGTLLPRAVSNMTSAQIDALLTGTPVTNGAGYVAGAVAPAASAVGDRLRITADGVGSLRVQNYLYNPDSKNFIEASSTQGVDFDGNDDRAPASEGQYQDQDAQRGLAK